MTGGLEAGQEGFLLTVVTSAAACGFPEVTPGPFAGLGAIGAIIGIISSYLRGEPWSGGVHCPDC
jgi:hypothetical protein